MVERLGAGITMAHILIVEQSHYMALALKHWLQAEGHMVSTTAQAQDALATLAEVDLVIVGLARHNVAERLALFHDLAGARLQHVRTLLLPLEEGLEFEAPVAASSPGACLHPPITVTELRDAVRQILATAS